jgi:integrase
MEFTPDTKITQLFRRKRSSGDRWVFKSKLKGSQRTITITYGRCDVIAAREARERARKDLAKIYLGQDPRPQHTKGARLTLAEAIRQFFNERSIKDSTRTSYEGTLNRNFKRWMNRPIREITGQECIARYQAIRNEVASRKRAQYADAANPPGEAEASKAIRTLGSILSHFSTDYVEDGSELLLPKGNPVEHLKAKRVRKPMQGRKSYLKVESRIKLLDWIVDCARQMEYSQAKQLRINGQIIKHDYLDWITLILCTGLRKNEPLSIKWVDVDFDEKEFTVRETKNGAPLTLPMTSRTLRIFESRSEIMQVSPWVFPQSRNPLKPATMSKAIEKVSTFSGVCFTAHVLRRTASTVLGDIGFSTDQIGRVLNHASKSITDEYVQRTRSMKRKALEELERCLFDFNDPTEEMNEEEKHLLTN